MQQLAILILKTGVLQGDFTGLSQTSQTIIKNYPDANTQGLAESLQFGKQTYDVLSRPEAMTSSEKALTDLRESFEGAIQKAKELGLATDGLAAAQTKAINAVAKDFQGSITDQILGINDPGALALKNLGKERDTLLKEAAYLNEQYAKGLTDTLVSINDIETLYGLKRQQIVEQQAADLTSFYKRLQYGDLSGATAAATLSGAAATYQATLAQAGGGNAAASARLAGDAESYINAATAAYGHSAKFGDIRSQVLSDIAYTQSVGAGGTGGAMASNDQWGTIVATQARQINTLLEQNADLANRMSLLIAELQRVA